MDTHEVAREALKIATEARELGHNLRLDHEGHIRECSVRYGHLKESVTKQADSINNMADKHDTHISKIYGILWKAALGIIFALATVSWWQYQQTHDIKDTIIQAFKEAKDANTSSNQKTR